MQENWLEITEHYQHSRANGEPFVLAVITSTYGSTYRKAGTVMLVNHQGQCSGLLSGGCLEADIALHAQDVFVSTTAKNLRYDLSADADLLWGLGLGCEGELDILLLPLNKTNGLLRL